MAGVDIVDSPMLSKCLDFCQALASHGQAFNISISIGPSFSFSMDTRSKEMKGPLAKKRTSPSTLWRNAKRGLIFWTRSSKILQVGSHLIMQLLLKNQNVTNVSTKQSLKRGYDHSSY